MDTEFQNNNLDYRITQGYYINHVKHCDISEPILFCRIRFIPEGQSQAGSATLTESNWAANTETAV